MRIASGKYRPAVFISTVATVDSPWHVAVDSGGNLYVTQINDAKVVLVTSAGSVATIGTGTHGFSRDAGSPGRVESPETLDSLRG